MKNIYFVLFFIFLFLQVSFVSAYNACRQGTLPVYFECQDSSCNSTETKFYPRDNSKQNYIIYHWAIKKNYDLLEYLEDNNKNFIEENYCENPNVNSDQKLSCSRVYDKTVKVTDMIYATHNIYLITWTKDSSWKYPQWSYKKFDNWKEVLNYYNTKVNVPRVCLDSDCNPTEYKSYLATTNPNFTVLKSWNKKEITLTEIDEPDVISWWLSGTNYKIWLNSTPIYINAKFRDYFPTGCNNPITYKLQSINPLGWVNMEFSDSVSYDNNNITITKKTDNYIEWEVREWFRFNTVGSNYIKAIFTDWFPNSIIRTTIPYFIDAYAWDVAQEKSFINSYQQRGPDFKYFAEMDWNEWSTLFYDFYLKDISGNPISLPVKIRPTNNTDKIIEYPSWNISWDAQWKYSFSLKFNNKTSTYIEEFDITVPKTDNFWTITSNYITIRLSANPQPLPIYSASETSSDFTIWCTNRNILFRATCTWDNLSWCSANVDSKLINEESQNGTEWVLYVRDRAWNATNWFKWMVDHLDKTKPSISNIKFNWDTDSIKADNSTTIDLDLNDYTPNWCTPKIDYIVTYNNNINNWQTYSNSINSPYNFTITHDYSRKWNVSMNIKMTDAAWNINTIPKNFIVYPEKPSEANSSILLSNSTSFNSLFPGSSYNYIIQLKDKYWNIINWKTVDSIIYIWNSALRKNMTNPISPTWNDAYSINLIQSTTDVNWNSKFDFKSLVPWVFEEKFQIKINDWNNNYQDLWSLSIYNIGLGMANYFKKPWTWEMKVLLPTNGNLAFGSNKVQINITKKAPSTFNWSYNIENFKSKLLSAISDHSINNPQDPQNLTSNPTMVFNLWTNTDAWYRIKPWVKVSPFITYKIWEQEFSYLLTPDDWWISTDPIWVNNPKEAMAWVRIIGSTQWAGKQWLVTNSSKFSDVSKSDLRTKIKKNVVNIIKWVWHNKIIRNVKFFDCKIAWNSDFNLSWEISWYETLVTKNCNIIINSNLNTSGKKFWIIALRDDLNNDKLWNIYIKPSVYYINAMIYADGWFISTWFDWWDRVENYKDSESRVTKLQNQLVLKWTLLTRNTIWWAIKWSTSYILPGWKKTDDFDKALMYDLNYIRRENNWHDDNTNWTKKYNLWFQEPFVIVYNPMIQTNPPKWFK